MASSSLRGVAAAVLALVALPGPADAVTRGTVARDPGGVRAHVVRIESTTGELCSGVLIAQDLVLTAAHCVLQRARYRVIAVDRRFRSRSVAVEAVTTHPDFIAGTTPRTQPGTDLGLIKLARPLGPDFRPLDPARAARPRAGLPVRIAGFGTTRELDKRTARTLREAPMVVLGDLQVANRVVVVVDNQTMAMRPGVGACRGDSGGPILTEGGAGLELVGIISWSSGALRAAVATACGGFTAVTPIADHVSWIASRSADLRRFAATGASWTSAPNQPYDWRAR
jgi:hypothetical protein